MGHEQCFIYKAILLSVCQSISLPVFMHEAYMSFALPQASSFIPKLLGSSYRSEKFYIN